MRLHCDHIVINAVDLRASTHFLERIVGFHSHPMSVTSRDGDAAASAMEGRFIEGNGMWLMLTPPRVPQAGVEWIGKDAGGEFVEINFRTPNYDAILDDMLDRGILMLDAAGKPIGDDRGLIEASVDWGEGRRIAAHRVAYWPLDISGGTRIGMLDGTGFVSSRDATWEPSPLLPGTPCFSHVAIFCRDLEASASFFTDVLGLTRHPQELLFDGETNNLIGSFRGAFIDARGVWLELVQPTGPGALMDTLNAHGEGFIAEICLQINDLQGYSESVAAHGVQMVNIDGSPLDERNSVLQPYGDRIAYFPQAVSCGMAVEVIERGPEATSCLPNWRRD